MPAKNLNREHGNGVYIHVYNRGVEGRVIFSDKEDCNALLGFLSEYLSIPKDPSSIKESFTIKGRIFKGTPHQPKNYFGKIELIAYSLMPDHFHLLLRQAAEGSLERFIRSLCTRYSIYFNKKYERTGSLFDGPYKSVQIKDKLCMLHLTRHLHRAGGLSSYAQYLGEKVDSWLSPKVVQTFFHEAKEDLLNGADSYKSFVEKYEPSLEIAKLLDSVSFDSEAKHLERRDLVSGVKKHLTKVHAESSGEKHSQDFLKPHQRYPEMLTAILIFLLLFTFGLKNVMVSTAKDLNYATPTEVLSATEKASPTLTPATTEENKPQITPALSVAPEAKLKTLTVKITDGGEFVNIRQKPTADSEKIGEAKNGERFEFVSETLGWYEVELTTTTGFISAKYIEVNGGKDE